MGGEPDTDRELEIYRVPIDMIPQVWPHVLPMLEKSLEKGDGDWTPQAILRELNTGYTFLHIAIRDKITGFAISFLDMRTVKPVMHVWQFGSTGRLLDHISECEQVARDMGAKAITFSTPRRGFERKNMGYRKMDTTYRKDLS